MSDILDELTVPLEKAINEVGVDEVLRAVIRADTNLQWAIISDIVDRQINRTMEEIETHGYTPYHLKNLRAILITALRATL